MYTSLARATYLPSDGHLNLLGSKLQIRSDMDRLYAFNPFREHVRYLNSFDESNMFFRLILIRFEIFNSFGCDKDVFHEYCSFQTTIAMK